MLGDLTADLLDSKMLVSSVFRKIDLMIIEENPSTKQQMEKKLRYATIQTIVGHILL